MGARHKRPCFNLPRAPRGRSKKKRCLIWTTAAYGVSRLIAKKEKICLVLFFIEMYHRGRKRSRLDSGVCGSGSCLSWSIGYSAKWMLHSNDDSKIILTCSTVSTCAAAPHSYEHKRRVSCNIGSLLSPHPHFQTRENAAKTKMKREKKVTYGIGSRWNEWLKGLKLKKPK